MSEAPSRAANPLKGRGWPAPLSALSAPPRVWVNRRPQCPPVATPPVLTRTLVLDVPLIAAFRA
jgi:hypothetical protein